MSLENELAELICSPIPLLEEVILNPHSSKEELYSIIPILEDIINNSNSLLSTIKKRIDAEESDNTSKIKKYIRYPIFYKDKLPSTCPNKYMVEKIWGLPFMRQRESWPKDANGNFLLFLCQIFDAEDKNILYRIFIEINNLEVLEMPDIFAFLPQIKHKYIIMPIELDKSKWLKSTAMVFKHMPYLIGEHFIKDWEICSPTESKKYALSIKERLDDAFY